MTNKYKKQCLFALLSLSVGLFTGNAIAMERFDTDQWYTNYYKNKMVDEDFVDDEDWNRYKRSHKKEPIYANIEALDKAEEEDRSFYAWYRERTFDNIEDFLVIFEEDDRRVDDIMDTFKGCFDIP